MSPIPILILILLIFWDVQILKKINKKQFQATYNLSKLFVGIFICLACLILICFDKRWDMLAAYILFFVPGYHLLKRRSFWIKEWGENRNKLIFGAFEVVIGWMFSVLLFSISTTLVLEMYPNIMSEFEELLLSAFFSSAVVYLLIRHASRGFSKGGFLENVGFAREHFHPIKVIVVPIMLGILFAASSAFIILFRDITPSTPLSEVLEGVNEPGLILIFLFLAIVIAPLLEEIIFRGYFFHVFKEIRGQRFAIYSISATFAILHVGQYWGDWMAICMVALIGFSLTLLRVWTKTTLASAIAHYTYNAAVVIIPVIYIGIVNPTYFENPDPNLSVADIRRQAIEKRIK